MEKVETLINDVSGPEGMTKMKEQTEHLMDLFKEATSQANRMTRVVTGIAVVVFFGIVTKIVQFVLENIGKGDEKWSGYVSALLGALATMLAVYPDIPDWFMDKIKATYTWVASAAGVQNPDKNFLSKKQADISTWTGFGSLALAATYWMHGGKEDPSPWYSKFEQSTKYLSNNYRTSRNLTEMANCIFEALKKAIDMVRQHIFGLAPLNAFPGVS